MRLSLKCILTLGSRESLPTRFYNLDDHYLIDDDGILIDYKGYVLWNVKWQQRIPYGSVLYLKTHHILLTDRLSMPGPYTLDFGICAIDMNTGKYLWKHWYKNDSEVRVALKQSEEMRRRDINLQNLSGSIIEDDYFYKNIFKIHLLTGKYEVVSDAPQSAHSQNLEKVIQSKDMIHDTVRYIDSIDHFTLNEDSRVKWGDKFSWFEHIISEARKQNLFHQIKIEKLVEFFDDRLLVLGKDMKDRVRKIWMLKQLI
ncbi:hypothetical protein [Leptospira paudalimensis]|uniref:Uncharacterized protein n=1 Tax=Leptospira paudalimensis TaxID=2950024 RepID=A0ABT3MCL2_9LEPT|nr:hypothetical protein [Leptospira paudalimensis]MCW7506126.1 hypothetical protein [Leptospira paudalimensis]